MNMIDYSITKHARERMVERSIPQTLLEQTLQEPTKILYDKDGRLLFKKLYLSKGQDDRSRTGQ
ncbi:DUF4258 domain-containing protein [Candidatus Berkelbacteria bacterium]|nr:DUF4258 domain-containing protein [Candidatus Berkelbacteria bacterium]